MDRLSHPSRGAWIEMPLWCEGAKKFESHPSRGAWIEIPWQAPEGSEAEGRTPHGVRGLKFRLGVEGFVFV